MDPMRNPGGPYDDQIGAPGARSYETLPPDAYEQRRDPAPWTGNRSLPKLEPVSTAIVGGIALLILGFLILVAPSLLRWIVGLAFMGLGLGAILWATTRTPRSDVAQPRGYGAPHENY